MSDREYVLQSAAVRERSILRNVYLWMAAGLGVTGAVALAVSTNEAIVRTLASNTLLFIGIFVAQIALVIFLTARLQSLSPIAAAGGFGLYAVLNGVVLSFIFLAYTGASITMTLFITAGTFAGMSVYAMTTTRDLSSLRSYLFMGLIGVLVASLVNFFLRSEFLYWIISYAGVAVFLGLTAYDTQMIKRWNEQMGSRMSEADYVRLSMIGALKLYLDFINLFLFLLRIFGRRR